MTVAAIALVTVLMGSPVQDEAALQAGLSRAMGPGSEVRVVAVDGPGDPGHLDADGDGVITREEFSAPIGTAFDRMDADHDGRLTTEELAAGHGRGGSDGPGVHVITRRGPGGPDGPGGHPMMFLGGGEGGNAEVFMFRRRGPEGGPPGGAGWAVERRIEMRRFGGPEGHRSMDTNNDGKVSEDEFLAPVREAFQSMDADHDGSLDDRGEPHGPPPPPHGPPPPANQDAVS